MKKLIFAAALCMASLFTSCSKEEEPAPPIAAFPDLRSEIAGLSQSQTVGVNDPFTISIFNDGSATTAPIVFTITKMLPVASITISDPNWTVVEQATRWKLTSNTGFSIPGGNTYSLSPTFVPLAIGSAGLTVSIVASTGGGETPTNNNITVQSGITVQ